MDPLLLGGGAIGGLLLLIACRIPVAVALITVSTIGIAVVRGPEAAFSVLTTQPFNFIAHWSLSAVPMFLLMGNIAYHSGLTAGLFRAARLWLSALPGGLAIASVAASSMFAAASGSSLATASAMGRMAIPEMLRFRYDKGMAAGSIAVAGTLGALIPPSILMVLYAVFAEISVSRALIAGIIPGLISALAFALMIAIRCSLNPSLAPSVANKVTWRERFAALLEVWPVPVLIVGVIGGMYLGIVTATEAAAVGAALSFAIAMAKGRLSRSVFIASLTETARATATIFFIALGGFLLSRFIALSALGQYAASLFADSGLGPVELLLIVSLIYLVLGMFLDAIGLMLITLPIFIPIFETTGIDLIWFGVIIVKLLEIGMVTPPLGLNVYVIKSIVGDKIPLETIFKGVLWFILTDIVVLALLICFPEVSLYLPSLMK